MLWVFIDEHPASINDGGFGFRMPNNLADTRTPGWVDYPAGFHNNAGALAFMAGHAQIAIFQGTRELINPDRRRG